METSVAKRLVYILKMKHALAIMKTKLTTYFQNYKDLQKEVEDKENKKEVYDVKSMKFTAKHFERDQLAEVS